MGQALKVTTQWLMHSTILPLAQWFQADRMFIRPRIHGTIHTDTMNRCYKSLDGNKHVQIFAKVCHSLPPHIRWSTRAAPVKC